MKVVRIQPTHIMDGVKKANIYGHSDRKNLGIKIPTSQKVKKEKLIQSNLQRRQVDIMEFRGANSDVRGKRNTLDRDGTKPLFWSKGEFNNSMGGGKAENSGFSAGGDFGNMKATKLESSGKPNINARTPAPFKLDLNTQSKRVLKIRTEKKKIVNKQPKIKKVGKK
jgi:hypothetical protein